MQTLVIRNLEIDILLSQLHDSYSNEFKKVWESSDMINAVFIQSERAIRMYSEQSITIIVQYYKEKRECEVTVVCSGGGDGLLRKNFGSETAAESTLLANLEGLARRQRWELNSKYPGHKGSSCPSCNAFYLYEQNQVQADGSVVCQNCNKRFVLESGMKMESVAGRIV